jgi:ATP-dependent Lon protease
VTLRGKVLEIGGVKEKVLAAYRAGLRQVILPKGNEKDLRDVPKEVRENMSFTFAGTMDEVIRLALLEAPVPRADQAPEGEDDEEHPHDSSPISDASDLEVGANRRAPGARTDVAIADR